MMELLALLMIPVAVVWGILSVLGYAIRRATYDEPGWRLKESVNRSVAGAISEGATLKHASDRAIALEGTVCDPGGTVRSRFTGYENVVHVHSCWRAAGHDRVEAQRGADFTLRLDDDTKVFVDVRNAIKAHKLQLLDNFPVRGKLPPGQIRAGDDFHEARVNKGDRVRVCGRISTRMDAQGTRDRDQRHPPMQPVLAPDPSRGLQMQRIAPGKRSREV